MSTAFRAFVVNKTENEFTARVQELTLADLPPGEVLIRVAYSGVDLSGVVVESHDARFHEGDEVIVTSYDLGVSHYGGFSKYARVKADWIVPLPQGLTLKEAMIFGTAGCEAALALHQLEKNGLTPQRGPMLE